MARTIEELASQASEDSVVLARTILEQDVSDKAWAAQIGPCLSQRDVARLLDKSEQAVSRDARLLRLHNRDKRPVYPIVQFDGRRALAGIGDVVGILDGAVDPLTVASWLTAPNRAFEGRRPIDLLRESRDEEVGGVARRLARRAQA